MSTLSLALLVALATGAVASAETAQPYAGLDRRAIKALSPERIEGLIEGSGLGYARAAELNGLPGPAHVLDLVSELALTPEQEASVRALHDAMRSEARAIGAEIVAAEQTLDEALSNRTADPETVARMTARIAALEGRLRAVHLNAHLATAPLLTRHQVQAYARARGYSVPAGATPEGHRHGG